MGGRPSVFVFISVEDLEFDGTHSMHCKLLEYFAHGRALWKDVGACTSIGTVGIVSASNRP